MVTQTKNFACLCHIITNYSMQSSTFFCVLHNIVTWTTDQAFREGEDCCDVDYNDSFCRFLEFDRLHQNDYTKTFRDEKYFFFF